MRGGMTIQDARQLVGQTVILHWTDRKGALIQEYTPIYKADFVPMYGPCLFTDFGEITLDKVVSAEHYEIQKGA